MPRLVLTPAQITNALAGIQRLCDERGYNQDRLGELLGIKQQGISQAFKKPSVAVALLVAKELGVHFHQLVDEGKLVPDEGQGTLMRAVQGWGAAFEEARRLYATRVPQWCWDVAGEWMIRKPPKRVTFLTVWYLALAAWEDSDPEDRQLLLEAEADERLKREPRLPPHEIREKFDPKESTPSTTRLQLRRTGPSKGEKDPK